MPPVVKQSPVRCAHVPRGDGLCQERGQIKAGERLRVLGFLYIAVRNVFACLPRDFGRPVAERPRVVSGELIGTSRAQSVVSTATAASAKSAWAADEMRPSRGAAEEGASGNGAGDRAGVVLGVPAVPQDGERDAGFMNQLLGGPVFGDQSKVGLIGAQQAGVHDA